MLEAFLAGLMAFGKEAQQPVAWTPPDRAAVRRAADHASRIFGDTPEQAALLRRTAMVESDYGQHPETYRQGYHGGPWQLDRSGFRDTQAVSSHPGLRRHYGTIRARTGIDWPKVRYEQIGRNPLLGAIAARLKYKNVPDPVPADLRGQAAYWKRHYNTHSPDAGGTPEKFVEKATRYEPAP